MIIRLREYTFQLGEPHVAGDPLTVGEAQALNRLRAENIRNNLSGLVKQEVDKLLPGQVLSADAQARLQAIVTGYDKKYEFVERHISRADGPIEAAVRAVAEARIEEKARGEGIEHDPTVFEILVVEAMRRPDVQEEGRRRAADRQQAAKAGLEELL